MDFLCVPVGCFTIDRRVAQVLPFTNLGADNTAEAESRHSATVHLSLGLQFQVAAVDLTDWSQAYLNKTKCGHPAESVTEAKHVAITGLLFTLTWQT